MMHLQHTSHVMAADDDAMVNQEQRSSNSHSSLKSCLAHVILAIPFLAWLVIGSLWHVHTWYVSPAMEHANWSRRLIHEITYYKRHCYEHDVTTRDLTDLTAGPNATSDQMVDQIMTHGALLFPDLLKRETALILRDFIRTKNANLRPGEAIDLGGAEDNRTSFGIGANDHPILPVALREVASNAPLRNTLEQLLGVDPALIEITAITSRYGAEYQGWHSDVKSLGNAVMYGRSFLHSYSLFIPLQDTTEAMGATDLCPGTHYCVNFLDEVCDEYGISASDGPNGMWNTGHGLLLNQQVWHRGGAHTDPDGPDRVAFILTFTSRPNPNPEIMNRRQLAFGTLVHMRWDMWGHTLMDFLDAELSMTRVRVVLRCLGLWKARDRNWGLDYVTAALMRMSNEGMEYEQYNLYNYLRDSPILSWCLAQYPEEGNAWIIIFQDALRRLFLAALVINFMVLLIEQFAIRKATKRALRNVKSILILYGTLLLATLIFLWVISKRPWAIQMHRGDIFGPAFPEKQRSDLDKLTWTGMTTYPEAPDILIGTRYDTEYLGAYSRWLDFHPGNVIFRDWVDSMADIYVSYQDLPDAFRSRIINSVVNDAPNSRRFLLQNIRGDWMLLSPLEAAEYAESAILTSRSPLLRYLRKQVSYGLSDCRYGMHRGTSLSKYTLSLVLRLEKHLFYRNPKQMEKKIINNLPPLLKLNSKLQQISCRRGKESFGWNPNPIERLKSMRTVAPIFFSVGDVVEIQIEDYNDWIKGHISGVSFDGEELLYTVSFTDEDQDELVDVSQSQVREFVYALENDIFYLPDPDNEDRLVENRITRIAADGIIEVLSSDGIYSEFDAVHF